MQKNYLSGEHILRSLNEYDAFFDMVYLTDNEHIEAFKLYEKILAEVPDSLFLLNVRDKDRWLSSCVNHPRFVERMQKVYGFESSVEVIAHWSADWDDHIANVVEKIPDERLLIFNIEDDPVSKFDHFVGAMGREAESQALPHKNYTLRPVIRLYRRFLPNFLVKLVPIRLRRRLKFALRVKT